MLLKVIISIFNILMDIILQEKPWFNTILSSPELQDITLRNLYEFYLQNDNIHKVIPIITSNSKISIRVFDWFVTNYSKKYNTTYRIDDANPNDRYFNVYIQYKCQLKAYKKKLFDPFCRKQRIAFYYDEKKCIITTLGQLNFFKWAVKYHVLDYVEKNIKKITDDMIKSNKSDKSDKSDKSERSEKSESSLSVSDTQMSISNLSLSDSDKSKKKRQELSTSANKSINIHNYNVVLTFD
jgi:hypothetical protein